MDPQAHVQSVDDAQHYTVQGVAALLKRHGWTCQIPSRRTSGATVQPRRASSGRTSELADGKFITTL
ncbi:winged helix-turn-helix domain-containing protein [Streptomyces sp. NPDC002172]